MPNTRTRVRKPIAPSGLMVLAVLAGLIAAGLIESGFHLVWWIAGGWDLTNPFMFILILNVVTVGVALASTLAIALAVSATTARRDLVFGATTLFVATQLLALFALVLFTPPYQPLSLAEPAEGALEIVAALFAVFLVAPLCGLVATILSLLFRRLIWRPIDQDGTLCYGCGYSLVQSAATTCPECGQPAEGGAHVRHRMHRLTHWVAARRRPIIASLVALVVGAAWWLALLEAPWRPFADAFAAWQPGPALLYLGDDEPVFVNGSGRSRRVRTAADDVEVTVFLGRRSSISRLELWLKAEIPAASPAPDAIPESRAVVQLEVPPDELGEIRRNGLDDAIVDRLAAALVRRHAALHAGSQDHADAVTWQTIAE